MNVKPTNPSVLPLALFFLFLCGCNESVQNDSITSSLTATVSKTQEFKQPEISDPLNRLRVLEKIVQINPLKDTVVAMDDFGSKLHIPPNAFVSADGTLLKEPVELKIKSYRNSAEIALSGIPMKFDRNGEEVWFDSGGMFEIQGYAKNVACEIAPAKQLKLDFAFAAKPAAMSFYRLYDDQTSWQKIQTLYPDKVVDKKTAVQTEIAAIPKTQAVKSESRKTQRDRIVISEFLLGTDAIHQWPIDSVRKGKLAEAFEERFPLPQAMIEYLEKNPDFYISVLYDINDLTREIESIRPHQLNPTNEFNEFIISNLIRIGKYKSIQRVKSYCTSHGTWQRELHFQAVVQVQATVQAASASNFSMDAMNNNLPSSAAAQLYSDVYTGLMISSFGTYNCDSEFRIPQPISIQASLIDSANDSLVSSRPGHLHVLFEGINTAITYSPTQNIKLSKATPCAILFATFEGNIYLADSRDLKKQNIESGGIHNIRVTDITSRATDAVAMAKIIDESF
jgi:hypothetical protein